MRIALYVPAWPAGNTANGIVTYASFIVPALRDLGHEVFVLTFRPEAPDPHTIDLKEYQPRNSNWNRLMFRLAPGPTQTRVMAAAIANAAIDLSNRYNIDALEIEESFGLSHTAARRGIVPIVVRLHGPNFLMGKFDEPINGPKIKREGQAIASANFVTACCAETLNSVKDYYSLDLPNSRIVPNSITLGTPAWKLQSCETNKILYVGRFDRVKGGDLALLAFKELASHFPNLRLTFVGPDRGLKVSSGQKISIDQFIRNNIPDDIRSRIDFLGQLTHDEVMSLRKSHFITIIAPRYDIQGYVMMEALSLGCPIVATAVGGIPEVISDREHGLLVPPEDSHALAASCETLLQNEHMAAQLGERARKHCEKRYSPKAIADQTVATYASGINFFKTAHKTECT